MTANQWAAIGIAILALWLIALVLYEHVRDERAYWKNLKRQSDETPQRPFDWERDTWEL